jgi:hypothetical protein
MIAQVPPGARLAVSNHVGPFAARRAGFYFFPPHQYYTDNTFEVAEYILVDVASDGRNEAVQAGLERLKNGARWELVQEREDFLLYHKKTGLLSLVPFGLY